MSSWCSFCISSHEFSCWLSVRGAKKDLFDSDGNYVKTACILYWPQTQNSACNEVNMDLFVIDSNESKQDVLKFATSIFGTGRGSTLWINGKRENDGDWYKKGSSEYPMWSELTKILDDDDEESQDESNLETLMAVMPEEKCLILSAFSQFKVETSSCGKKMYPVCEYTKTEDIPQQPATTTEATTTTEEDSSDDSIFKGNDSAEYDQVVYEDFYPDSDEVERDTDNEIDDDDSDQDRYESSLNFDEDKWWKWIQAE
jgi:hypothetical protein